MTTTMPTTLDLECWMCGGPTPGTYSHDLDLDGTPVPVYRVTCLTCGYFAYTI